MKKVVVVGGGITGLAAAYHLQEKAKESGLPLDYLLIERDQHLGGKIVTEKQDGFVIEGGPDCFVQDKPAVVQLSTRVGITDKLLSSNDASTGTFVLSGGKLHKLPDGLMLLVPTKIIPFALSPLISWPGKLRMGLDLLLPKKKTGEDESLASFVKRRLGKEALDKIGEPMIGGIHGSNSQTMSLKATFPRFLKMEEDYRSLVVAMLAARAKAPKPQPPKPGQPKKTYFMSFKGGMSDLVEGVESKLDANKILKGTTVTRIEKLPGQRYKLHLQGKDPIEADAVIFASPAWDTAAILEDFDEVITRQLQDIPQASSATINMVFHRKDVPFDLGSFGFVIPASEQRQINALTFSSVKWNHRVPSDQYVSLRTFVGGGRNQELALLSDEELIKVAKTELADILGLKAEPVLAKVHHWIKARPQYVLGHLERIKTIDDQLENCHSGIYLAGAAYRGIGVPDCVNDGMKAAEKAISFCTNELQKEAAR